MFLGLCNMHNILLLYVHYWIYRSVLVAGKFEDLLSHSVCNNYKPNPFFSPPAVIAYQFHRFELHCDNLEDQTTYNPRLLLSRVNLYGVQLVHADTTTSLWEGCIKLFFEKNVELTLWFILCGTGALVREFTPKLQYCSF